MEPAEAAEPWWVDFGKVQQRDKAQKGSMAAVEVAEAVEAVVHPAPIAAWNASISIPLETRAPVTQIAVAAVAAAAVEVAVDSAETAAEAEEGLSGFSCTMQMPAFSIAPS